MDNTALLELKKSTFYLDGLTCANCAAKIEEAIHKETSYQDVSFSFATKKLRRKKRIVQRIGAGERSKFVMSDMAETRGHRHVRLWAGQ